MCEANDKGNFLGLLSTDCQRVNRRHTFLAKYECHCRQMLKHWRNHEDVGPEALNMCAWCSRNTTELDNCVTEL